MVAVILRLCQPITERSDSSGAMWKTYPLVYHVNPVCPGPPK